MNRMKIKTKQKENNVRLASLFRLMKAIADQTRMDPRKRMQALRRMNQRLQNTAESQAILKAWNVALAKDLIEIDGRVMGNEKIHYGDGVT